MSTAAPDSTPDPGAVQASAIRRLLDQGRLPEAVILLAEVRRRGLDSPALLHAEGALALAGGQFDLAEARLRESLARYPANAEAHYQLGRILKERGLLREAMAAYDAAIVVNPAYWQAHGSRGIAARAAGLIHEAIQSQERVLALRPGEASAQLNLANALLAANDAPRALKAYDEVLKSRPGDPSATRGRTCAHAMALLFDRQWQAALVAHREALALEPESLVLKVGQAVALLRSGDATPAKVAFAGARARLSNDLVQCWMVGRMLQILGRQCAEARFWFEHALTLASAPPIPLLRDYIQTLSYLGEFAAAEVVINAVLAVLPGDPKAHAFHSLLLLWRDDYTRGFAEYEHRFLGFNANAEVPTGRPRVGAKPWAGESLDGKCLFLWAEQGAGDALQFVRYLPVLLAREPGMQLDFVVHDDLKALFTASFPQVAVQGVSDPMPPGGPDVEAPLMSLPQLLGMPETPQPVPVPYLHVAPERMDSWRTRLGPHERLRVGLAWAGNPDHFRDPQRSLPLALLAPLKDPRIEFHALQKGPAAAQMDALPDFPLLRTARNCRDFHDTAAVVAALDLVISVDTSVVHLAGGLGVSVWVLLSRLGEWRWGMDREDCRWYPTARLFRQAVEDDWTPVVARVRDALQALLAGRS